MLDLYESDDVPVNRNIVWRVCVYDLSFLVYHQIRERLMYGAYTTVDLLLTDQPDIALSRDRPSINNIWELLICRIALALGLCGRYQSVDFGCRKPGQFDRKTRIDLD